jgi:hypothetical protein
MQTSDSHMFRFSESPTNMILCPLSLSRNSLAFSLEQEGDKKSLRILSF